MSRKRRQDECNVNVVVRCRPTHKHESKKANVRCSGREVAVEQAESRAHTSAIIKKFTFDKVYDETTKQADVFTLSIFPLVKEVLQGFNCTVFAYGQTGTGKTFTMEGDTAIDKVGMYSDNAGVIPRAAHAIFSMLKNGAVESTVRVSFLEIYNEELKDLLSDEHKPLRVMESTTKTITVHNLEQILVRDSKELFSVMHKGILKRRTAQTKLNPNSSRSHSLFTITIHMKEVDSSGEEIIKIGNLNMVDLAGSECVARSGAVAQRAKEAGMINTSLLTLGRVISALVDHLPYVPYRDSKLTRLLQESLGGRTKTVIIATISPIGSDETLSTLEYAHRAKRVMNKPEINQKLTHRKYVKDMTHKIAELQRENECLRLEHGIYLPPERFEQMNKDLAERKENFEELQCRLDEAQKEFAQMKELFDRRSAELEITQNEKEVVEANLVQTQDTLAKTTDDLSQTRCSLAESRYLVREHEKSEFHMVSTAEHLRKLLAKTQGENEKLFSKIDRKDKAEDANQSAAAQFRNDMLARLQQLSTDVHTYKHSETKNFEILRDRTSQFLDAKIQEGAMFQDKIMTYRTEISQQTDDLTENLDRLHSEQATRLKRGQDCVKSHKTSFHTSVSQSLETQQRQHAEMSQQMAKWSQELKEMGGFINNSFDEHTARVSAFTQTQNELLKQARDVIAQSTQNQLTSLSSLNSHAKSAITDQRAASEKMLQSFAANVQSLVTQFAEQQAIVTQESLNRVQSSYATSVEETKKSEVALGNSLTAQDTAIQDFTRQHHIKLSEARGVLSTTQQNDVAHLDTMASATKDCFAGFLTAVSAMQSSVASHCDECAESFDFELQTTAATNTTLHAAINTSSARHLTFAESESARVSNAQTLTSDFTNFLRDQPISAREEDVQAMVDDVVTQVSGSESRVNSYLREDFKTDQSTGQTPAKRPFKTPQQVKRTESHSVLLDRFHRGDSSIRTRLALEGTPSSTRSPLAVSRPSSSPLASPSMCASRQVKRPLSLISTNGAATSSEIGSDNRLSFHSTSSSSNGCKSTASPVSMNDASDVSAPAEDTENMPPANKNSNAAVCPSLKSTDPVSKAANDAMMEDVTSDDDDAASAKSTSSQSSSSSRSKSKKPVRTKSSKRDISRSGAQSARSSRASSTTSGNKRARELMVNARNRSRSRPRSASSTDNDKPRTSLKKPKATLRK